MQLGNATQTRLIIGRRKQTKDFIALRVRCRYEQDQYDRKLVAVQKILLSIMFLHTHIEIFNRRKRRQLPGYVQTWYDVTTFQLELRQHLLKEESSVQSIVCKVGMI